MRVVSPFVINFASLKKGNHIFNFNIDIKFFESFDYFDFKSVDLKTTLELEKQETMLGLLFKTSGHIIVPCDLSLENFKMPFLSNLSLAVKFGKTFSEESDEILILPHGSHQIDISQYIFEMVVLSIPIKKVHPGIKNGTLNSDILIKLNSLKPKEKKTQSENDSRWDKLKDLL
jgi:uncharacterized metal-binding protein YceD (DUF177 family)|tara:strand:+ start:15752 stop:16273 length:522 start_codon:yes stop_codon:yes gene_type:complete